VQHHIGQGDLAGFFQRFAQQCIDLAAAFIRGEKVRRVDVLQGDLVAGDEGDDFDGLGGLGVGRANFVFAEHHIASFFKGHALDDIVFGDFLAGGFVDALIAHRVHAALVQPVEVDAL